MVELVPEEIIIITTKKSSILFPAEEFTLVTHFYWDFLWTMK